MVLNQGEVLSPEGMLAKLFQDMYLGNGKAAVTVRLEAVETSQERIERLLSRAIWLGIATLTGTLGSIAIEILKVVMK